MDNIYKPTSLKERIHIQNRDQLLKLKRPLKSFKKSFKPKASFKTKIKRQNTNILHQGFSKEMLHLKKLHESSLFSGYSSLRYYLLFENVNISSRTTKIVDKPNFVVEDFRNPPKKNIIGWRRKKIKDKDGYEHIINLAIIKDPKTGKTKTVATSLWHSKEEPKAKKLEKLAKES